MKINEIYIKEIDKKIIYHTGSNAKNNFEIIDDSNPNDLWFHLNDYSSSHTIAKIPNDINKKELKYIIKRGALLCKMYSKYNSIKDLSIIYTKISNIVKTDIVGKVELLESKTITI
jgi:predicted ribosome quality control (RQC) complex YloA/Tae2 family protein